jgi:inner membrane protein
MENFAHTLVGAALARAGLDRKTPLAAPALIVAANLPDIDVLGGFFGQNYLDFHRGISHAAVGIAVLSLTLAFVFWLLQRFTRAARATFATLIYICFIGLLSHPLLDFLNDYGIRPWLPFSGQRVYGDVLSIVDPWLWIIFGSALSVASRGPAAKAIWGLAAAAAALLIGAAVGPFYAALWCGVLAAALVLALLFRRRGVNAARAALLVFGVYLSVLFGMRWSVLQRAWKYGPSLVAEQIERIDVLPGRPDSKSRWTVVMQTAGKYYLADVGLADWGSSAPHFESYEKNLDSECYRRAMHEPQIASMSRFARFPAVLVESSPEGCTVFLRDLRYARRSIRGWGVAAATVDHP